MFYYMAWNTHDLLHLASYGAGKTSAWEKKLLFWLFFASEEKYAGKKFICHRSLRFSVNFYSWASFSIATLAICMTIFINGPRSSWPLR